MPRDLDNASSTAIKDLDLLKDKEGDPEQIYGTQTDELKDEGNVGLHEFDVAKQSGMRVCAQESRR